MRCKDSRFLGKEWAIGLSSIQMDVGLKRAVSKLAKSKMLHFFVLFQSGVGTLV